MTSTGDLPYDCDGSGDPVVFVHAFPLDGRMWARQAQHLARSHRVIVPDLRGFGRAAAQPPAESLEAHAADLCALLDKLAIARATMVGLSMGGYIALAFARRHRDRLARLALADTRSVSDSEEGKQGRNRSIATVEAQGAPALVDGLLPKMFAVSADDALRTWFRTTVGQQPTSGVAAALRAMRDRVDAGDVLGTLRIPVTVIVGEHDAISTPGESQEMARAIPGAQYVVISAAAHLSNLERPAEFNAALDALLARD